MRVRRGGAAEEAGLRGDEAQMLLVADPVRFGEDKGTLIDRLMRS
jgi:hypothetical protein